MPVHIQIDDIYPEISYEPATAEDTYAVPFPFFSNEDLVVYVDGDVLTLTADYTVTGAGESLGGEVVLETAVSGVVVMIVRDIPIERTTDFPASGPLQVNSLNTDLDKLTAICQELDRGLDRALHLFDGDVYGDGTGRYDAHNNIIGSLAPGVDSGDAVTVGQVTALQSAVVTQVFATRAIAQAASIAAATTYLIVTGDSAIGDGGLTVYKKVVSEPAHAGKFQSVDLAWWEKVSQAATQLFATRAAAAAAIIPSSVNAIRTAGYTVTGKGGGIYVRAASLDANGGGFQSADGAFWILGERFVEPYHFAATGDGVANDTTAVQNWVNFAAANGRVAYAGFGSYAIPTLTVTMNSNLQMLGSGPSGKFIRTTVVAIAMFQATSKTGINIQNCYFQYTAATVTATDENCPVLLKFCSYCSVINCISTGPFYLGFYDLGSDSTKFLFNKVIGAVNRAFYGACNATSASTGLLIEGNTVVGTAQYTIFDPDTAVTVNAGLNLTSYGINTNGFGTGTMVDCTIANNDIRACRFQGISFGDRCHGSVIGNQIASIEGGAGAVGILVQLANTFRATDILVANNRLRFVDAAGIYILQSDYVTVIGNMITGMQNASSDGILVNDSTYVNVNNNLVRDGADDGIRFVSTTFTQMVNNTSINNADRGFRVDATNASMTWGINRSQANGTNYTMAPTSSYNLGVTAGTSNL